MLEALLRLNPWFEPLAREQVREGHRTFVDNAGDWAWQNLPGLYQSAKPTVPFEAMEIGMENIFEMRMSRWATWYFACCTGDFNRVHFDPRGVTPFKGPICHGMHLASLISRGLGTELPGQGTIFSRLNNLVWKGPVYIGEHVKVTNTITKLDPRREPDGLNRVSFASNICNEAGKIVVEAEPIAYVQ